MGRFAFPKKYAIRPLKGGKGKTLCYATVIDTELGIEFRDVRLIAGKEGEFVAAPFRTYEDKDGETQYSDYWRAAYDEDTNTRNETGAKYLAEMAKAVSKAYRACLADDGGSGDEDEEPPRAAKKEPATTRRSARGPVPTVDGPRTTKSRLPF